jgi:DNA topoisomerase-1
MGRSVVESLSHWRRRRRSPKSYRHGPEVRFAHSASDPAQSARAAHLTYVGQTTAGIRRVGAPGRFRYLRPDGKSVNKATCERILSLAIPPAWTDIWICPDPNGHLQAVGRDAKGRKQYRYHRRWREVRDETKFGRLAAFAKALPTIRARAEADLRSPGLNRSRVLAAVVELLEKTLIRVGNEEYARDNRSYGLTTLRNSHARIEASAVRFVFRGKSGKEHHIALHDRRLARIVKDCRDLPGQELFQYIDADGNRHNIGSGDVNEYIREISRQDFTAKDFRTWAGTVLAASSLATVRESRSGRVTKRDLVRTVESVADRLGNTKAVCRKSYIHPAILDAYLEGKTIRPARSRRNVGSLLTADERAVLAFLERRARQQQIA